MDELILDPMQLACGAGVSLAIAHAYVDGTLDPNVHTLEYGLLERYAVERRAQAIEEQERAA